MNPFIQVYLDLQADGEIVSPRGKTILELENYQFTLEPRVRFTSFVQRKLNLDYIKEEFLWYLRADPRDELVTESAQMWKDLRQNDGTFLSNYGVYWFFGPEGTSSFSWVLNSLMNDRDSRQAVMPMLKKEHLYSGNPDVVCTYAVGFRIRYNRLNMSVSMRSQDAIWGMTNDVACFSFLHEMVYVCLRDSMYHTLQMGTYTHKVDSLHVYERHFDMLHQLTSGPADHYEIDCPKILNVEEALNLITYADNIEPEPEYAFSKWLLDNRYRKARHATKA
jgi:thymidylate synthase